MKRNKIKKEIYNYNKIHRSIESCNNTQQLGVCEKLLEKYKKGISSSNSCLPNILSDKIKQRKEKITRIGF